MKILVVLLLVALCAASKIFSLQDAHYDLEFCDEYNYKDVISEYRTSVYTFVLLLYKKLGARTNYHFVFTPISIWRILAAVAEGADPDVQQQLFEFLSLPYDPCTRQKYYKIMKQGIKQGDDVKITNKRFLVFDQDLTINQNWLSTVYKNSMLDVIFLPIKKYPLLATNYMRQMISSPLRSLNLNGNSVILDSIDYNALWTTAFADAVIQRAPFYDQSGQKIGSVDLMTVRKRVRTLYNPETKLNVVDLPVGLNGRYRVVTGVVMSENYNLGSVVEQITAPLFMQMIDSLKLSDTPINIAIPRFTLTSDIDVRRILEDAGLSNLWVDPAATRYVSEPAALPSSYAERATLTFDKYGISPSVQEPIYNVSTGLDLSFDFIANRPFLLSVIDAETFTVVLAVAYTKPTYSY